MKILTESQVPLLTRSAFREGCLERDGHRCVMCGRSDRALDVHHITERRLFISGGYHLSNGVTLCDERTSGCHTQAEQTLISPRTLRERAGIEEIILPEQAYHDAEYTKWLDLEHEDGRRSPGPLFWDPSVQRILSEGGVLERYDHRVKYFRTWHLPGSQGVSSDDRQHQNWDHFKDQEVVVTLKLDGQNLTLYRDGLHGRALDGHAHPSQSVARARTPGLMLDPDMRLVVENLQARHTLRYQGLPDLLMLISAWRGDRCLDWDETSLYAEVLDLPTVPVLWRGVSRDPARDFTSLLKECEQEGHEGVVIRRAAAFRYKDSAQAVGKLVSGRFAALRDRTHHNWKRQTLTLNSAGDGPLRVIWPGEPDYDIPLRPSPQGAP